nr:hypothetical protein [Tanacetum cinerariifolium]
MSRDGSIFVYNPDVLRKQFAGLVIQRGLPFNHFDDEQITRVAAKQAIIDGFVNLNTNVNLPKDVWSAPHGVPDSYICVTAHWIEPGTWQMMKRVIAFEDFLVSHTGSALARTLRKTFVNLNLENKIMSITLDNASNNTSTIASKGKCQHFPAENWVTIESITQLLKVFNNATKILSGVYYPTSPLRKQHKSGLENPIDFEEEILDAEVQQNEAISLFEEEIALDVASSKGTMSGSGTGAEEVDYDMTNYGYDYE